MDRALHAVVGRLRRGTCIGQPLLDRDEVAVDLGTEDLQQHRVDRRRHARFLFLEGSRHVDDRFSADGKFEFRLGGRGGWLVASHCEFNRRLANLGFGSCLRRRDIQDFLTRGEPVGDALDALKIGADGTAPLQRSMQLRQGLVY